MAGNGPTVGRINIKVTPDLHNFWADLKAGIEKAEAQLRGEIQFTAKLDTGKMRAEAAAAAKAASQDVKVTVKADKSDFAKTMAEVKAAARDANVKVDIDFQDLRAEGELAALIAKLKAEAAAANIKLHVDVDKNHDGIAGGLGKRLSLPGNGIRDLFNFGTPLNLIALLTLLPPALAVLSAGLLSLPALFTAVAAPIGVFALGLGGIKDALDATGFLSLVPGKTNKKGVKTGKDKQEPGEVIKDLQKQISDVFKTGLTPVFQNFANVLPQITAKLPSIATGIVDIIGGIGNALTSPAAVAGIQQLSVNIGNLLSGMAPGIQSFIESLGKLATGVSNHFPGLANWFNSIADKFSGFVTRLTTVGADGKSPLDAVVSNLKPTLDGVFNLVKTLFGDGTKLAQDPGLADKIKSIFDTISSFATDTLPALAAGFKAVADILSLVPHVETPKEKEAKQQKAQADATKGTGESNLPWYADPEGWGIDLKNAAADAWNKLKSLGFIGGLSEPSDGQPNGIEKITAGISNFFNTTLPGMLSGLGVILQPYWDQITSGITGALSSAGTEIANFFTVTIPGLIASAGSGLSGIWDSITAGAGAAWDGVVATVQSAWASVTSTVQTAVDNVVSFVQSLPGRITAALGNLGGLLVAAGKAAMDGLLSGIKAGAEAVYSFVSGIAAKIASLKGPLPYDRRVLTPNGMALMQGLQDGLEGGFDGVLSRTKQMADQLSAAVKDGLDISGSKNSIAQQLKEVQLEMDQLRVQRDALAKGDPQRKVLGDQMQQLTAAKDQLKLQGDNLGYAQKYGAQTDSTSQAAQMITKALASMLDMAKGLVMAPAKQLESDLGISGNGAIPQIADQAIGWGMQSINSMVQGAFGQGQKGSSTTIQVNNDSSALAMKNTLDARESMTLIGR